LCIIIKMEVVMKKTYYLKQFRSIVQYGMFCMMCGMQISYAWPPEPVENVVTDRFRCVFEGRGSADKPFLDMYRKKLVTEWLFDFLKDAPVLKNAYDFNHEIMSVVNFLIEKGVLWNDAYSNDGFEGWTLFHFAVRNNNFELVRYLSKRVNVNAKNSAGYTPLHIACILGYPEIVSYLVSYEGGAIVFTRDNEGKTPLHKAVESQHVNVVEQLVQGQSSYFIDAVDRYGQTALHSAVALGNYPCIHALLKVGADPYIIDQDGDTAAYIAKRKHMPLLVAEHYQEFQKDEVSDRLGRDAIASVVNVVRQESLKQPELQDQAKSGRFSIQNIPHEYYEQRGRYSIQHIPHGT